MSWAKAQPIKPTSFTFNKFTVEAEEHPVEPDLPEQA